MSPANVSRSAHAARLKCSASNSGPGGRSEKSASKTRATRRRRPVTTIVRPATSAAGTRTGLPLIEISLCSIVAFLLPRMGAVLSQSLLTTVDESRLARYRRTDG